MLHNSICRARRRGIGDGAAIAVRDCCVARRPKRIRYTRSRPTRPSPKLKYPEPGGTRIGLHQAVRQRRAIESCSIELVAVWAAVRQACCAAGNANRNARSVHPRTSYSTGRRIPISNPDKMVVRDPSSATIYGTFHSDIKLLRRESPEVQAKYRSTWTSSA